MSRSILQHQWIAAVALVAAAVSAFGQIKLDGTVGPSGPLTGPNYSIPDSVGRTVGNNLFHSFSQFNLATGESASFSGPATIRNVISRVTGGSASSIDGMLECTIPGANFFFINPFGVIFGPNAQVNVSGSFVVSTADYVKLADGGRFDARNPANDILTVAPVSAFGFLGPTAAGIQVKGPPLGEPAPLFTQVPDNKTIAFIGGDIRASNVQLLAPGGSVAFLSAASAGEVAFDADNPLSAGDMSAFARLGIVELKDSMYIDVSGLNGGRILARANEFTVANNSFETVSYILALTYDTGNGLGVDIEARQAITFLSSSLMAMTFGDGNGGDIKLTAPSIRLDGQGGGASISSGTYGAGKSGNIWITANSFDLINGGAIDASTSSSSAGGNINIVAHAITLDGKGISSGITSIAFDEGNAGTISIKADSLTLDNYARILTDTYAPGAGGHIVIQAGLLRMGDWGWISSSTQGSGQGGTIDVTADSVVIDAHGTTSIPIGISATTTRDARGGDIVIKAGSLMLQNNAQIATFAYGNVITTGDGGNIDIHVTDLTLDSRSSISSASGTVFGGTGKAGSVTVRADNAIVIRDGASVSVAAAHNDGGDINLSAGSQIRLENGLITAEAYGNGGNVHLTTLSLVYLFYSQILAKSVTGDGGNITIDPQFVILDHSSLVASAVLGNGGNVSIVSDYFLQDASTIDVSSEFGVQGMVRITAPNLELRGKMERLPADLLDPRMLLLPNCSERVPGGTSSFFMRGRGGAPMDPGMLLPVISRGAADR